MFFQQQQFGQASHAGRAQTTPSDLLQQDSGIKEIIRSVAHAVFVAELVTVVYAR